MTVLILLTWLEVIIASTLAHEYAHALAGKLRGWQLHGMKLFPKRGAIAYIFTCKPDDERVGTAVVATAGLATSAALMLLGYALFSRGLVFQMLFAMNAALLLINLLPFRGTDGWHVLRGLRA